MKLRAYCFWLPLARPLRLAGGVTMRGREGVLLRRGDAWAEASPLPGFSTESLRDVKRDLRERRADCASMRFAMAALDRPDRGVDCAVSALLTGDLAAVTEKAERVVAEGCVAAKIKVGGRAVEDDVRRVRAAAASGLRLRPDANQQWRLAEALAFVEATADLAIDYVEEPVVAEDLEDFAARYSGGIALDESRGEGAVAGRITVDKPTVSGWLGDPGAVLSSAFESGVGLYRIAQAAAGSDWPVGLDTYDWLKRDVLRERLRWDGWRLRLDRMPAVDESRLEELWL